MLYKAKTSYILKWRKYYSHIKLAIVMLLSQLRRSTVSLLGTINRRLCGETCEEREGGNETLHGTTLTLPAKVRASAGALVVQCTGR
jgi:hypothetical protein